MKPGDAYLYDMGVLHSPRREGSTRLLRIEGMNMERVKRLPYEAVDTVTRRGGVEHKRDGNCSPSPCGRG